MTIPEQWKHNHGRSVMFVYERKDEPGTWATELIGSDGEVYLSIFYGPDSKARAFDYSDLRVRLAAAERERDEAREVYAPYDYAVRQNRDLRATIAAQSAALAEAKETYKGFYKWVAKKISKATYADEELEQGISAWQELKDSMFNGTMASFEHGIDESLATLEALEGPRSSSTK